MTEEGRRRILRIMLAACAGLAVIYAWRWFGDPEPLFPDVFGFWTFGQAAIGRYPAGLYDTPALYAAQRALGMPEENGGYPFPYPPWFMLAVAPLGWLAYPAAAAAWRIATAGLFLAAVRARGVALAFALVAPASIVSFVVGQNGFLTAALMLGGLCLLGTRPFVSGMLLGSVAYKPQFAILIPFFLVFGRHWRALTGAVTAALLLTILTALLFGPDVWLAWAGAMRGEATTLAAGRPAQLDHMATFTSAVLLLGGGRSVAHGLQGLAAAFAVWALWRTRRQVTLVLPFATLVATPYAFGYDLPVVTGAALMLWSMPGPMPFGFMALLMAVLGVPLLTIMELGAWTAVIPVLHIALVAVLAWGRSVPAALGESQRALHPPLLDP